MRLKARRKRKERRYWDPAKRISTTKYGKGREPSITLLKTADLVSKECRMRKKNETLEAFVTE